MPYILKTQGQSTAAVPIYPCISDSINFPDLLKDAFEYHNKNFSEDAARLPNDLGSPDAVMTLPIAESTLHPHSSHISASTSKRKLGEIEDSSDVHISNTNVLEPINWSHQRRKHQRNGEILERGHEPRPDVQEALLSTCLPISTELQTEELPTTSCGYQAKNVSAAVKNSKANEDLETLKKEGYEYIEWDGFTPRPILDKENRVIGVLAGRPSDHSYDETCDRAFEKIVALGESPEIQDAARDNRRGNFPALNIGVTHGKGTVSPVNLHTNKNGSPIKYSATVEALLGDADLTTIATFASYAFATWAPNVYQYYRTNLNRLWEKEPHLRQNFPKSVFPCAAVNFGPNVWTQRHRDSMNCPFGMCAIQALGQFDHTRGGQLVLPDLKLVIEFPANLTILIPSATLLHANVPVLPGDRRASFTQYCPGGLFRYVDNRFMTERALRLVDMSAYNEIKAWKAA